MPGGTVAGRGGEGLRVVPMVREILIWPDPILKQKARPVAKVDDSVRALIQDMFETMYAAEGVGLAAPQVGILQRVIVLDTRPSQPDSKPLAMINPEFVALEGETTYTEGCLSIPGEAEDVDRAAVATVRYLDEQGQEQTLRCDGLLAIAVQHETDHLDGTVFVDHVSTLKREFIRKRMKKLKASRDQGAPASV
jgi:peptide deformylase